MTLCFTSLTIASDETWQQPFIGSDPTLLYLPDAYAVYWRYGWNRTPGDMNGIVISGTMPDVRYFSYNVYNDNTKDSIGSITDFELIPDEGGENPFSTGQAVAGETYTVHVLPEGSAVAAKNILYFSDSITNVSIALRHYLPKEGNLGGVAIPQITTYDASTKQTVVAQPSNDIPRLSKQEFEKYLVPLFGKLTKEFKADPEAMIEKIHTEKGDDKIDVKKVIATQVVSKTFSYFVPGDVAQSYNFQASGTYPNKDNHYLTMPLVRSADQALLLKFTPPPLVEKPADYPVSPVRYYSMSQGDEATFTHGTIIDADMKVHADGNVYILVADDEAMLRTKADAFDLNFMPWEATDKMLMVYRHMLPTAGFKNGVDKVPVFDLDKPAVEQAASLFIGDYAPRGILINKADVLSAAQIPDF